MAIEWMVAVWKKSKVEKSNQLLTFLAIADNTNEAGVAWPGRDTISTMTRQTPRTISRILKELEETGELFTYRRKGRFNYYFINLDREKKEAMTILQQWFKFSPELAEQTFLSLEQLLNKRRGSDNLSGVSSDNLTGDKLSPVTTVSPSSDTAVSHDPLLSFKDLNNNAREEQALEEQAFPDIRSEQGYKDLQNEIIAACKKLNILALKEEDIFNIDILYASDVQPAEIREFYSRNDQSSWWASRHWKGKKGQFATTQDIVDTIEQARAFTSGDSAELALKEVQEWVRGDRSFPDFSSQVTLEVIRDMGEYELKNTNPAFWTIKFRDTFAKYNPD